MQNSECNQYKTVLRYGKSKCSIIACTTFKRQHTWQMGRAHQQQDLTKGEEHAAGKAVDQRHEPAGVDRQLHADRQQHANQALHEQHPCGGPLKPGVGAAAIRQNRGAAGHIRFGCLGPRCVLHLVVNARVPQLPGLRSRSQGSGGCPRMMQSLWPELPSADCQERLL